MLSDSDLTLLRILVIEQMARKGNTKGFFAKLSALDTQLQQEARLAAVAYPQTYGPTAEYKHVQYPPKSD